LIDLILRYEGNKLVIRVLADKPEGGINLGECAVLNRALSGMLEERKLIEENYLLEVSSPGLDRSLKNSKDFLRCKNKEVVFFLNEMVDGKLEWQGKVTDANEGKVIIGVKGKIVEIAFNQINKARLVI